MTGGVIQLYSNTNILHTASVRTIIYLFHYIATKHSVRGRTIM